MKILCGHLSQHTQHQQSSNDQPFNLSIGKGCEGSCRGCLWEGSPETMSNSKDLHK